MKSTNKKKHDEKEGGNEDGGQPTHSALDMTRVLRRKAHGCRNEKKKLNENANAES